MLSVVVGSVWLCDVWLKSAVAVECLCCVFSTSSHLQLSQCDCGGGRVQ